MDPKRDITSKRAIKRGMLVLLISIQQQKNILVWSNEPKKTNSIEYFTFASHHEEKKGGKKGGGKKGHHHEEEKGKLSVPDVYKCTHVLW